MNLSTWRKRYNVPTNKLLLSKAIEYQSSKDWYPRSHNAIVNHISRLTNTQATDKQINVFINLLAATSPRNTVKQNLKLADKTFMVYLEMQSTNISLQALPSYGIANKQIRKNVIKALMHKPISGAKVKAFAEALEGHVQAVCIDVWMMKVFHIPRDAPTKNDRAHITTIINKIASQLNWEPRQVQAALWTYAKTELNDSPFKESNDFSHYLAQTTLRYWSDKE